MVMMMMIKKTCTNAALYPHSSPHIMISWPTISPRLILLSPKAINNSVYSIHVGL